MKPKIRPGRNIALKIPPHQYNETVAFYRDILQLPQLPSEDKSIGFDFDGKHLWLDKVNTISHAEMWLEICADDLDQAARYFESAGVIRRDEIEQLPPLFKGFWIASPSGQIHLVSNGS